MEKFSSFERVVGNISEAEKEQILRDKGERFDDQVFEDLKGQELEQTPEELQIIDLVNEATNEIRRQYGLQDFDIPPKNIHFMTEEQWLAKDNKESLAFYDAKLQAIFMKKEPKKILLLKTLIHEMLHFKSYNALQMTQGENRELHVYRVGLKVYTRDGEKRIFDDLNEAVTEELAMRIMSQLLKNPLFAETLSRSQGVMAQYPRAETDSGEPLFNTDTYYAEIDKNNESSVKAINGVSDVPKKPATITVARFADKPERKTLNTLIDKILERNQDKFQDREEVFEVFAKGMMTGNILPIGRLIEKTFGNGTLRLIGELDQDMRAQEEFVNSL